MKKFKLTLTAMLAFIVGLFGLVSCGERETKIYAGTYKFESMNAQVGGETFEFKVGDNFGGSTLTENYAILDLKEDGGASMTIMGTTGKGSWKPAKGKDKIVVTIEDDPMTVNCDGKTAKIEIEGVALVLVCERNTDNSADGNSEQISTSEQLSKEGYIGTYKFQALTVEIGEETREFKVGDNFGGSTLTENYAILDLKEDGGASMTMMGTTGKGSWESASEKGKIVVTIEDDPITIACDGKTAKIEMDGVTLLLARSSDEDPGEDEKDTYAGTYKFHSMILISESASTELKIGDVSEGITLTEDYVTLRLTKEGDAILSIANVVALTGTWTEADEKDKIVLTLAGEEQTIDCDKANLKFKFDEGLWFVLKK